jgi:hypothetical protein
MTNRGVCHGHHFNFQPSLRDGAQPDQPASVLLSTSDRETIKTSPPYDPDLTIDRAYEARFHGHHADDPPVDHR